MKNSNRIQRMGRLYAQLLKAKEQEQQHIRLQAEVQREQLIGAREAFDEIFATWQETAADGADVLQWHRYEALLEGRIMQQEQAVVTLEGELKIAVEKTKSAYQQSEKWNRFEERVQAMEQRQKERTRMAVNDELALNQKRVGVDHEE
ncbi:hypothetical protein [Sulfoacidibacillus thermotolerans]|uniref:Flagellar FliJ protein n=1 Tax=Sulfoacidibacillus thermotolerans TaxID=1765684 RepID=A0A2U3DA79_SULT2|nr:hypothetical protein [Sulfoacidibacillus thermotolerans]PWI58189.1 hypothetical protein BM613_04455 [Sulfoacidibacillus thermotolerans]